MWGRRRHIDTPPPPVRPDSDEEITVDLAVQAALARATEARRQLNLARAREPQVRARVRSAQRQLRRNGLGELFDQALGMGPGVEGVGT